MTSDSHRICPFCEELDFSRSKSVEGIEDVLVYFECFRYRRQEYFICLSLDSSRRVIGRRIVTVGLVSSVMVHPREVFVGALEDRASFVIVGHNHPSGDVKPSSMDIEVTQQLVAAGIILGIRVEDHVIVGGKNEHYSFKEVGLL